MALLFPRSPGRPVARFLRFGGAKYIFREEGFLFSLYI